MRFVYRREDLVVVLCTLFFGLVLVFFDLAWSAVVGGSYMGPATLVSGSSYVLGSAGVDHWVGTATFDSARYHDQPWGREAPWTTHPVTVGIPDTLEREALGPQPKRKDVTRTTVTSSPTTR